jgi:putative DNA primase/helicase
MPEASNRVGVPNSILPDAALTGQANKNGNGRHAPGSLDAGRLPHALRALGWVTWQREERVGAAGETQQTKVPYDAKALGRKASSTDARTWAPWEVAKAAVPEPNGERGIGVVLHASEGTDPAECLTGLDLDHCITYDAGGRREIALWANRIVERFRSYTEITPSGTGLRIFLYGAMPAHKGRSRHYEGGKVEAYDHARFFTVTGQHLEGTPLSIEHRDGELQAFVDELWPPKPKAPPPPPSALSLSDRDLVEKCRQAKNGEKFRQLFDLGDLSAYADDHSRADLALVSMLAFFTQDEAQINRLMQASALHRPKWEDPRPGGTYGLQTIRYALSGLRETYDPKYGQKKRSRKTSPVGPPNGASGAVHPPVDPPTNGNGHPPPDRANPFACTDMANGERLAKQHGTELRYDLSRGFRCWDEKRWGLDPLAAVRRAKKTVRAILLEAANAPTDADAKALSQWAVKSAGNDRIKAMVELAKSEPGIAADGEQFDADPMLLNVANGTLDLRTGILRRHNRADLITKLAPVEYDPDARCPTFERFLEQILPGAELRAFVQCAIGYSLTGLTHERCFFIAYGSGDNGKTTLLETLQHMLGRDEYAHRTPTETLLPRHRGAIPNDVARLKGLRFVFASETEEGQKLAVAFIKDITGGDTVAARFMRAEWFDFTPEFKLWLATNHRPVIRDSNKAIWNRIRLIPFLVTIPKADQDPELPRKLLKELPGILAWSVRGCLAWQEQGLNSPEPVRQATDDYRTEMDLLADFLEERCIRTPKARAATGDLYRSFAEWCATFGEKIISHKAFAKELELRGLKKGRTGTTRFWEGLGLIGAPRSDTLDFGDGS